MERLLVSRRFQVTSETHEQTMNVLLFGIAKDLAGVSNTTLNIESDIDIDEFWALLLVKHPELAVCRQYARLAADLVYVETGMPILSCTREVALIPPVSGG